MKDYFRSLEIVLASAVELETQIVIADNLGFVNSSVLFKLIDEIKIDQKMISGLMRKLNRS